MITNKTFSWLFIALIAPLLLACDSTKSTVNQTEMEAAKAQMPKVLQQAIEAHGGFDRWHAMQTWAYSIERNEKNERHFIDLKTRKVLIKQDDFTVGFDGEEVWITPNLAAFGKGSPRFFHNLYWYFHAFPFVMTDPGINYEVLPPEVMKGKKYDAVKITYNQGVGDAPDDEYIAHFDPETHQMYLLLYTVTYFNGKPGDKYNAIIYDDWKDVNGLLVPNSMKGYKYNDGELGEQRYKRDFNDIILGTEPADQTQFEMPEGAEIDALIQH